MKAILGNRIKIYSGIFFISICLLRADPVNAQENDSTSKYKVYLEPYLFAPSMSGTVGIGNLPNTFICVPAGKVLSYFKIGGMLYAEVHNDRFAFTSDVFYASLSQDASSKNGIVSGTADLKQFWWELEGLYRLNSWLEAGVGARINNITAGLSVVTNQGGSINKSGDKSNTWVDPLIVARLKKWVDNKWMFSLRADIGGFGIGSQFAWQLQPDVFFRVSRLLQLGLGYRAISMDYSKGSGSDRFLYDLEEYGPQLRIGFNL
jgi:hypothetical protein